MREGRRKEFAKFAAFTDPAARERIPDPNAESTFTASRPQPGADATAWEGLYRQLIELRTRMIVPRLQGATALGAQVLGAKAVTASWRLADGAVLSVAIDLGDQPAALPEMEGEVLFAEGNRFVARLRA